jgi:SAM-dependent methyltransferase
MPGDRGTEQAVAQHYTRGGLERAVLDALRAAGKDPDQLEPADLAPVDEFHIGGHQATMNLAAELHVAPGMHLLDIGSGLGGASRYFAHALGCTVTGIDLTEEFVQVAEALSARTGLAGRVSYRQGSALALPFSAGAFDAAYMLHVGMNIADKATLLAGVRRVLKPRGLFGIYDVMREREGALTYPVPWATSAETDFVESSDTYARLLADAGFEVRAPRSRREEAIAFFRELRARVAQAGSPPLGLHIVMGPTTPQKIANMVTALEAGLLSPTEIIGVRS